MTDIDLNRTEHYQSWLAGLKDRIRVSQLKAAVRVNTELMLVYWQLGKGIVEKQQEAGWGDALIEQLSRDLSAAFPEMKGFSRTNLFYIRKWYLFYSRERESVPQLVGQLSHVPPLNSEQELVPQLVGLIPWGHNREIVTKCSDVREALFYVSETIRHGWSRAVLQHQLESGLYRRQGTEFQPEYAGKLSFYLNAVDAQLRHPDDNPSIGILLCKTPNKVVVEYSLKNAAAPLGVAEYRLTHAVPEELKGELPTIEELEEELDRRLQSSGGRQKK